MKYTILGFNQSKMLELEMDLLDAHILRWFIDFKDGGKMYSEIINDDKYYWLKYDGLLKDIPMIKIGKVPLGRRLKALSKKKVLKQIVKKVGGTYTMYAIGEKYIELLSQGAELSNQEGVDSKINRGVDSKINTKNPSTNLNPSTNNIYSETFESLWKLYPLKRDKHKVSKKSKEAMVKIGFDKMKLAIERYVAECKSCNRYYKNGSTFFNGAYEDYIADDYEEAKKEGDMDILDFVRSAMSDN